jgi:hypothetical protein
MPKSRVEEKEGQQQLFILFFCFGYISHLSPCAYIFASSYLFCDCAIFARPPGEESFIFCLILNQKSKWCAVISAVFSRGSQLYIRPGSG